MRDETLACDDATRPRRDAAGGEARVRPGRFLRINEVMVSVGLRRTMIYRLMKDGRDPFPAPVKLGCASRWAEDEVADWKLRRLEERE
jgi:prophage regulatory protein